MGEARTRAICVLRPALRGESSRKLFRSRDAEREQGEARAVFEKTGWPLRSTREGNVVHTTLTLPPQDSRRNRTITANEPEAR